MTDRIVFIVRFRISPENRQQFQASLDDVSAHIVEEATFVEFSLLQDGQDPEVVVLYEVWNESLESFTHNQLGKKYRANFEKLIVDLNIDRTASWYTTVAERKHS